MSYKHSHRVFTSCHSGKLVLTLPSLGPEVTPGLDYRPDDAHALDDPLLLLPRLVRAEQVRPLRE